jgi:hypothetical protein
MSALDPLPWPWGEEILAKFFAAKAFIRPAGSGRRCPGPDTTRPPDGVAGNWRSHSAPITAASWPGKRSWESGLRMTFAAT